MTRNQFNFRDSEQKGAEMDTYRHDMISDGFCNPRDHVVQIIKVRWWLYILSSGALFHDSFVHPCRVVV